MINCKKTKTETEHIIPELETKKTGEPIVFSCNNSNLPALLRYLLSAQFLPL